MATHAPLVATRTRNLWLSSVLLGALLGALVLGVLYLVLLERGSRRLLVRS
ncbi:MAG TPA: hypothetical protein VHM30_07275 [Gemmatimonadaceae bacterium]|nr:hypothetical protein [Gemmatimonadaceae bacterium]